MRQEAKTKHRASRSDKRVIRSDMMEGRLDDRVRL